MNKLIVDINDQTFNHHKHSLTVAIPCLNEEKNIENAILSVIEAASKLPELRLEIIVIDDGSKDRTAEIVLGLSHKYENLLLIQNPVNLGLGASIRLAIDASNMDKFLFIPGDNDIPVTTLDLLFGNAHVADVVMTYFHNDESRGRIRYLLSNLFRVIYTTTFDLYAVYVNGPAIYPANMLKKLKLHSTRFSIVVEINVKLLRQGVSFVELASNRQVGNEGSTSATWRSLIETFRVFLQTFADVYFLEPERFSKRPLRKPYTLSLNPIDTESLNITKQNIEKNGN